jgi:glycogen debranching enzyme
MARLFDGFRIDNCHSTPIHVASYLLDVARRVKPDLYVFAELFTGSEDKDIMFVGKLGINSLIREAMNAWDPKELSRLVHRHGGEPVGSLTFPPEHFPLDMLGHPLDSTFYNPVSDNEEVVVDVRGSAPHALFMDCTHDNETPHQKRTAEDTLPNAALVAMSNCAIGSVKGYDEVVPELLNVVTETRKYRLPEPYEGIITGMVIMRPCVI